eukprot:SAG31_NODE_123_length_23712_cov_41.426291_37_plen_107_part_00
MLRSEILPGDVQYLQQSKNMLYSPVTPLEVPVQAVIPTSIDQSISDTKPFERPQPKYCDGKLSSEELVVSQRKPTQMLSYAVNCLSCAIASLHRANTIEHAIFRRN